MNRRYLFWDSPFSAIITLVFALLIVGGINVLSASAVLAMTDYNSGIHFFWRFIFFAVLGAVGAFVVVKVGYKRLLNPKFVWLLSFIVLLMLGYVWKWGEEVNGANRWIRIPGAGFNIQPSEFAKLAVIMLCSSCLAAYIKREKRPSFFRGVSLRVAGISAVYFGLVMLQPDMGTASIIMALMFCGFIVAGLPWKHVGYFILVALAGVGVLIWRAPYRLNRLLYWIDPWSDAENMGYQSVQSLVSIGSGGILGTNWGQGTGKLFYLPEAHTDFAYAIFCQENGLVGVVLLMVSYMLLLGAMVQVTMYCKNPKAYLMSAGITLLVVGQSVSNMAMVCGILPVIGVPLVFISYGGSSMLTGMLAIGFMLSICLEEQKDQELEKLSAETRRQDLHFTAGTNSRWGHEE